MDANKRKLIDGWIDKAGNHLQVAKDHLQSYYRYSESIEASQECVELSVKSVLSLLGIEFPPAHGWDRKQFADIAAQIAQKQLVNRLKTQNLYYSARLPRLLLVMNLWAQFYIPAKYGFEDGSLAPAQDLFEKQEAELALQHAKECHQAASELRYLDEAKLAALIAEPEDKTRPRKEDHPELDYLIIWRDTQGGTGPTPPPDAVEVHGDILVETISHDIDSNTIAFWLEDSGFGTLQVHANLRGNVPKQWRISSFGGRWWVKNLTMIDFRVVEGATGQGRQGAA
jgi:HEPN domain-containing protein